MRRALVVLIGVAPAACASGGLEGPWPERPLLAPVITASQQGRTPAVITTQKWSGGASKLCFAGPTKDATPRLQFGVYADRCLPASDPDVSVQCAATTDERGTLYLSVTYRFDRAPPYPAYGRRGDDCDRSEAPHLCVIDAPPPGNYVVKVSAPAASSDTWDGTDAGGELALPITVGYRDVAGPCTDGSKT